MINVTNRLFDVLLFDQQGRRLYLTDEERKAFLKAASKAPREVRSFCSTLHYTGCRISEALALTPKSIDLSGKVIVSVCEVVSSVTAAADTSTAVTCCAIVNFTVNV